MKIERKIFPLIKKYWVLLLFLGLHLFLLTNLQFTAWPEMLSYPYFRNQGFWLYKDMVHPYTPVLTMVLSMADKIFGYQLWIMQALAWSMILVNDILIFLIVQKLTGKQNLGYWTLGFYLLIQPFLEGNMLWPDTAIVTPIMLATYFLLFNNYLLAGIFLAVAALTKQTAGIFLVITSFWLIFREKNIKKLLSLFVGSIVLGGALFVRLLTEKAFVGFLNWTLLYPSRYWTKFPNYVQMGLNPRQLLILFLICLPQLLCLIKFRKKIVQKGNNVLLIFIFLAASFLIIYPRFSFFHFQVGLAFLAVILGYLLNKTKVSTSIMSFYFLILFLVISRPVITRDWQKEARFYGERELKLAQLISQKTSDKEKIYLLNHSSAFYALANRSTPKPWADNFGWYFMAPDLEEEITASWKAEPPVIFWQEPEPGDWWELGTYEPAKLTNWIKENYTKEEELEKGFWLWRKND